jgi:hypothetical protein
MFPLGIYNGKRPSGSITGLITADDWGDTYANGHETKTPKQDQFGGISPCGRYRIHYIEDLTEFQNRCVEIQTVEGSKPLFRLIRPLALQIDIERTGAPLAIQRVSLLQDKGPLMVKSGDGHFLEFFDFDIPKLALTTHPESFHVVSQPQPIVVAGGAYDYQVQVNNPSVITGYKLREPTSGATISATGLLHFQSVQSVTKPTEVNFTIEIEGKDGQTLLHHFPILVLPRNIPLPPLPTPGNVRSPNAL